MNERKIRTGRLEIIPFDRAHITDKYINWLNDPEVVKFSSQRFRIHTKKTCEEYLETYNNTSNYFWAIIDKANNYGHIGNINAYIDINQNTADLGIIIGEKKVWGKGFGLEAWEVICEFLFNEKSIRKITAGTLSCNKGMLKIAEKSGMKKEGRRLKQEIVRGEEVDVVYFGLFNSNL